MLPKTTQFHHKCPMLLMSFDCPCFSNKFYTSFLHQSSANKKIKIGNNVGNVLTSVWCLNSSTYSCERYKPDVDTLRPISSSKLGTGTLTISKLVILLQFSRYARPHQIFHTCGSRALDNPDFHSMVLLSSMLGLGWPRSFMGPSMALGEVGNTDWVVIVISWGGR